ncbi:molybdate ABC transporter substrate-binding protein [Methylomonas methanica]|uniref:Molybdenum ABC transporter, periplasmic molybdate-binding protein n=1 Tax=Methylomonas methanica (strain DSM 25384 / MC09) TaxID=857087 RepID=G0A643_METMM|nr:molybdate ABC transporter substrate-binding protein [Methylomonas methanica]AEG00493.1 molybdenum ABC transporter, periplasmic molybdate-binding protein [Methylomonas methanica MC09]
MSASHLFRLIATLLLLSVAHSSFAETVLVAVASNFTKPMSEIAAAFERETGHTAKLSFGSSGKIVSQLENGAPFEIFLSADDEKPLKLEQAGLTVPGSRFTYALGTLVLWSAKPGYVDEQGQILAKGGFSHLALADPKLAPYGAAAMEVIQNKGLTERLQPLLVRGENISQAYQFVGTGNAELGFVALSQVIKDSKIGAGSGWIVPASSHTPIRQDAVLMKTGEENPAAPALLAFLKAAPAKAIIEKYGYGLAH